MPSFMFVYPIVSEAFDVINTQNCGLHYATQICLLYFLTNFDAFFAAHFKNTIRFFLSSVFFSYSRILFCLALL